MEKLTAENSGETKCFIFVDEITAARESLKPYASKIVAEYPFIGAFGAEIFVHKLDDLMALPCVKAVSPHTVAHINMDKTAAVLKMNPLRQNFGYGEDISVAVIDTGVSPHIDFLIPERRIEFVDFLDGKPFPYDDNGHGTAVSSIICGNGLISGGRFKGICPKAKLYGLKAIGANGEGGAFKILLAMQWLYDNAEEHNIKVVCLSFGSEPGNEGADPLSLGAEALWRHGITVIASAGNDGPGQNTIKSPGINPYIITVGGAKIGDDESVTIPDFSSRGLDNAEPVKPDLIAPSVGITACGIKSAYERFTGTSMAAPIVAGIAALILSKNPSYSPNKVKELLLSSAKKLPFPEFEAGRGLINLDIGGVI
jgi:serine protease AprX